MGRTGYPDLSLAGVEEHPVGRRSATHRRACLGGFRSRLPQVGREARPRGCHRIPRHRSSRDLHRSPEKDSVSRKVRLSVFSKGSLGRNLIRYTRVKDGFARTKKPRSDKSSERNNEFNLAAIIVSIPKYYQG